MSFFSKLFGGGVSQVGGLAKDIREAIKGKELDPEQILDLVNVQSEINKLEAQNRSVFVSGWRPFVGWICGVSLLYNFIVKDLINYVLLLQYADFEPLPALQMEHLMTVLMGMLGLGGLRTYEKYKGLTK